MTTLIDRDQLSKQLGAIARSVGQENSTDAIAEIVYAVVSHLATKAGEEIGALQARIANLESCPFEYTGAHVNGQQYRKGQFASQGGSVWHANTATTQRPGDGPAWTLAVKAGRDAR